MMSNNDYSVNSIIEALRDNDQCGLMSALYNFAQTLRSDNPQSDMEQLKKIVQNQFQTSLIPQLDLFKDNLECLVLLN
ncbi:MAG: hypothetical protein KIT27_11210, partial [Legionellales bacterium]|nr:hypothetical protein [Legionellales bacterium]